MPIADWTRDALTDDGFEGWVPWKHCPVALSAIPNDAGGVYVVYRLDDGPPRFLERSPAGTWRGEPTVTREALEANWVPGAAVLNVGKANHGRLRARLREYMSAPREN